MAFNVNCAICVFKGFRLDERRNPKGLPREPATKSASHPDRRTEKEACVRHWARQTLGRSTVMGDSYDSVSEKVAVIFRELAGERSKALDGSVLPAAITSAITAAQVNENAGEKRFSAKTRSRFTLPTGIRMPRFWLRYIFFQSGLRRHRFRPVLICFWFTCRVTSLRRLGCQATPRMIYSQTPKKT